MSPVKIKHSFYQGRIQRLLESLLNTGEVMPECAILRGRGYANDTSDGVKVADVVWCSAERFDRIQEQVSASIAPEICIIDIPTLCYLKGVSAVGACRLCMVEIVGASKLFAACVTQVEEGMEVIAHNPKLKDYRRMVVELLFAEGNHICAFCVANDNCELQDAAVKVGMTHSRFPYRSPDRHVSSSICDRPQSLYSLHSLRASMR